MFCDEAHTDMKRQTTIGFAIIVVVSLVAMAAAYGLLYASQVSVGSPSAGFDNGQGLVVGVFPCYPGGVTHGLRARLFAPAHFLDRHLFRPGLWRTRVYPYPGYAPSTSFGTDEERRSVEIWDRAEPEQPCVEGEHPPQNKKPKETEGTVP